MTLRPFSCVFDQRLAVELYRARRSTKKFPTIGEVRANKFLDVVGAFRRDKLVVDDFSHRRRRISARYGPGYFKPVNGRCRAFLRLRTRSSGTENKLRDNLELVQQRRGWDYPGLVGALHFGCADNARLVMSQQSLFESELKGMECSHRSKIHSSDRVSA